MTHSGGAVVLLVDPVERRRGWIRDALTQAGLRVVESVEEGPPPDVVLVAAERLGSVATILKHRPLLRACAICHAMPDARLLGELRLQGAHDVAAVACKEDVAELVTKALVLAGRSVRTKDPIRLAADITGASPAIEQLRRWIAIAAASEANVRILGESGTGKDLAAKAIHWTSRRASGPYVAVNCSSIPEDLFESEMFGHEKGSFTGAIGRTRGHFEQAHGGTLFLDEIAELSPVSQAKLLRVLQPPHGAPPTTRELTRVGGEGTLRVDVRILCATHRDLDAEAAAGRFREDLLQRLEGIDVRVPPLRDRGDDVVLLARLFLEQFAAAEGRPAGWFDDAALTVLRSWSWPRNVRELESILRSIVAARDDGGPILIGDLPLRLFEERDGPEDGPVPEMAPSDRLDAVIRAHVLRILSLHGGNRTRAARHLGISRQKLGRMLNGEPIDGDPPEGDEPEDGAMGLVKR